MMIVDDKAFTSSLIILNRLSLYDFGDAFIIIFSFDCTFNLSIFTEQLFLQY